MKIAIRGGHNYGVPGACGIIDELTEDRKYFRAVMNYLQQAGHQVLDVTPEKTETVDADLCYGVSRANAWGAELFISCHLNAGGGHGCEVIYYNGSVKGKEFAVKASNAISTLGFTNRGAKADMRGLYELRRTNMPAIIIEPLFVDTESDVELYIKIGADTLAKAIAEAISGKVIISASSYPGYSLKYGTKGDSNVKLVQQKLGLATDGDFGPKTLAAVKSFQQTKGLVVDGIVGPKTWSALFG